MSVNVDVKGKEKGRDTEASRTMLNQPGHSPEALLADGDTNERLEPGYDQFTVTERDRRAYGIEDHEEARWIRNPHIWRQREMGDRGRMFLNQNPGGRIVKNADGGFVENGDDLILATVPKSLSEAAARERDRAAAQEEKDIADRRLPGQFPGLANEEALEEIAHATRAELAELGLLGPASPSHGMDYEAACARFGGPNDLRTLEREADARSNGRAVVMNDEYIERVMEARRRAAGIREEGRGKREEGRQAHLTGNNPIGPRNRQEREQAFAQARQR